MSRLEFDITILAPEGQEPTKDNPELIIEPRLQDHKKIFDVLSDYLQPDSTMTAQAAIEQTLQYWPEPKARRPHPVCDMILAFAKQIPYDHPGQFKLVEYVETFGRRYGQGQPNGNEFRFWDSLGMHMADLLDAGELGEEGDDPYIFANTTAFSAILLETVRRNKWFESSVRRAADFVLKGSHTDESDDVRSAWILGVAQWFIFAAGRIYGYAAETEASHERKVAARSRPFFSWCHRRSRPQPQPQHQPQHESHEFTSRIGLRSWHFWITAFRAVAEENRLSAVSKAAALRAADSMEAQEGQYQSTVSPVSNSLEAAKR